MYKRQVLQFVKPYFTPADIEKGARWGSDIAGELESSDIGIICLTKDNTQKPWILFEAGPLSKSLEKAKVCTVLFGVDTTDLKGPLTIFQHTKFQSDEFKKLVKSVNSAGGDSKLDDAVLDSVFDMWWPKLEKKVKEILANTESASPAAGRSERDILEEILELTRLGARDRRESREFHPMIIEDLLHGFERLLDSLTHDKGPSLKAFHMLEGPLMHLIEHSGNPKMGKEFHFRLRDKFEEVRHRRKVFKKLDGPSDGKG